ncbi:MAG TPA: hypothetical protein VGS12_11970 [Caulobacteraceae bacterium]|nr:hypothetical protein [Caulobacteraceae bacterium]
MRSPHLGSPSAPYELASARPSAATKVVFLLLGLCTAAWAPLIPFAKARLGVDPGVLGLILLCGGAGSIATMALAGALAARLGCRAVILAASLALLVALPALAVGRTAPAMIAALLVFGGAAGAIDVAANIHGIAVEKAAGRPMMSGFHGFYSFGGIAGAAGVASLMSAGLTPLPAVLAVDGVGLGLLL